MPHLLRVLSTIEPIIGSLSASNTRVPSIKNATAIAPVMPPKMPPAGILPNNSASVRKTVKYEPIMVQIRFCPKPAMPYATASFGCKLPSFGVVP